MFITRTTVRYVNKRLDPGAHRSLVRWLVDPYVLGLARQAFARGLDIDGKHYAVTIVDKDGQSNPQQGKGAADG
jgi:hypothetical protein